MDDERSKHMRWMETTKTLLGSVYGETCQPYRIPFVPDELRKLNEKAYMPKVVSIGPRHRGRRDLLPMEEIKWRCTRSLLNRSLISANDCLEECMEAILKLDAAVRASYVHEIKLDMYDLAAIMLLDGFFLLELLFSGSEELDSKLQCRLESPSPGEEVREMELVLSDLTLLENQIPLFILITLLEKLFKDKIYECCGTLSPSVIRSLALSLFGFYPNFKVNPTLVGSHFLEIVSSYIHQESQDASTAVNISGEAAAMQKLCVRHLTRCATWLQAVGITIKYVNNNNSNTHKVSTFQFNIKFNNSNGVLEIPQLHITQTTEAQWKNFIAWEHHKKNRNCSSSVADRCCLFTSSAFLFSDLICCASDVQLLKDRGVIVDHLSMSNQDLETYVHSILEGVDRDIIDPTCTSLFYDLNTYSATYCARKISILFYHLFWPWIYKFFSRGYNFAATMITVLTVVQTCYAIIAYHFPKK